jgi:hypothetical protein
MNRIRQISLRPRVGAPVFGNRFGDRKALAATLGLALALLGTACSKDAAQQAKTGKDGKYVATRSKTLTSGAEQASDAARCDGNAALHEVSEYDTSGDDQPDVRKVFLRVGEGTLARLVLICRESDLNADGNKDVVRSYSEEGRPLREEADRNFDGRMDELTIFQEGQILRQEFDTNNDAKIDTKIYFDAGKPLRAERDLTGRSTAERWQPDRWEYYEDGRVVRMGTDLDGDGTVDRWDRDVNFRRGPDLSNAPASKEPTPTPDTSS